MAKFLDDILILVGESLIVAGAYMCSLQAALYVAGIAFIADGVLIGLSRSRNDHS